MPPLTTERGKLRVTPMNLRGYACLNDLFGLYGGKREEEGW